jgi:hypothetical protein
VLCLLAVLCYLLSRASLFQWNLPLMLMLLACGSNGNTSMEESFPIPNQINTDYQFLLKTSNLSHQINLVLWVLLNSLILLKKNSHLLILLKPLLYLNLNQLLKIFQFPLLSMLIGLLLVKLPQLRTKENVVHAGLSLLLVA